MQSPLRANQPRPRVEWLDGIRGLAALYVLLHHTWLYTWPNYPENDGPAWVGWLTPGHLGVVVFVVVSGYSLTMSPRGNNYEMVGGVASFARRRAWRILPPYWAALVVSVIATNYFLRHQGFDYVDMRSTVVHALLLQDVIGSTAPNGVFWSIAVEVHIYVFFPLLLLTVRKGGRMQLLYTSAAAMAVAYAMMHSGSSLLRKVSNLSPHLYGAFALGMLAAATPLLPKRQIRFSLAG